MPCGRVGHKPMLREMLMINGVAWMSANVSEGPHFDSAAASQTAEGSSRSHTHSAATAGGGSSGTVGGVEDTTW